MIDGIFLIGLEFSALTGNKIKLETCLIQTHFDNDECYALRCTGRPVATYIHRLSQ